MALENLIQVKLPTQPVAEFTPDQFKQLPAGTVAQMIDFIIGGARRLHRDIFITAAGTAQTVGQTLDLYKTGQGEQGTVWNTGATFIKSDYHTSMDNGGTFPYGVTAVILAFQILCVPYPAKAATVGSSATIGTVTDSADNATQPTGFNALAFFRAMMLQNKWQFQRGAKKTEESGLLIELPATQGFSGFAGAATATLVQNTTFNPVAVLLKSPKVIEPKEDFFIRMTALSALAQPVDFVGWFGMDVIETGGEGRSS